MCCLDSSYVGGAGEIHPLGVTFRRRVVYNLDVWLLLAEPRCSHEPVRDGGRSSRGLDLDRASREVRVPHPEHLQVRKTKLYKSKRTGSMSGRD